MTPPYKNNKNQQLIDMELTCSHCHSRLLLPTKQALWVHAEITKGRQVILVCGQCGTGNSFSYRRHLND